MNDKLIGVASIVFIIFGLVIADIYVVDGVNPSIIRLADISIGGILGNMIGVHLRMGNKQK